jgi:hypothetical protein
LLLPYNDNSLEAGFCQGVEDSQYPQVVFFSAQVTFLIFVKLVYCIQGSQVYALGTG